MLRSWDQHLAAEMAALLFGRELVLEMDACRAGLDIGFHDLERIQRAAKSGLGVGHDRREPIARDFALGMFDLVGALKSAVDLAGELRTGIGRIERLIGIHGAGDIGVGRDLPAGKVNCFETAANHLHRLVAGDGAQGMHIGPLVQQLPKLVGAALGERIGNRKRAAKPRDILGAIRTADTLETPFWRRRNEIFKGERLAHQYSPISPARSQRLTKSVNVPKSPLPILAY